MKASTIAVFIASTILFISIVPFVVSGQTIPEMLDGQWFSVKASLKGYGSYNNDEATEKGGGSASGLYIYTTYDSGLGQFTMTTCSPVPGTSVYHPWTVSPISVDYIYGDSDPKQVWNFLKVYEATGLTAFLRFEVPGGNFLDVIPMLVMTVKADGSVFKSASFKSEGCIGYWFAGSYPMVAGSCKLSGKTVDFEKVPIGARMACIP
jgi:hypothetical protein